MVADLFDKESSCHPPFHLSKKSFFNEPSFGIWMRYIACVGAYLLCSFASDTLLITLLKHTLCNWSKEVSTLP
uniref:Uncharacterized protein n=1 Tax=Lotus japonicus TaxID=34305 RepID=I3SZ99_LOTJA|nr:unknown [Lotus japonicus]